MFFISEVEDYVRVDPRDLKEKTIEEAIKNALLKQYEGKINKQLGWVLSILDILDKSEGYLGYNDGGIYYKVRFKVLTWKPILKEVTLGIISNIVDFGAYVNIGPTDGLIHISQIMDDIVDYSKDKVLAGRKTKKILKIEDIVKAKIVGISIKPIGTKINLTMRQAGLGKLQWLYEEKAQSE
ncbi:NEQ370 [Nanoarchaeum equitans Kin4-M]|uniref:DNA-directed RNA polymerase subunit Rpo7 n=1 Tax=Nanoarchaeum equitans (strain Kin4-M) TaxID=228908 RepID=Q74MC3_NANEQ|nr:NEQ370 [Nanoarchaeum equitans Kin4-M]